MTTYGTVGYDVGSVGRWTRVGYGLLIALGASASTLLSSNFSRDVGPYVLGTVAFLAAITLAYLAIYGLLGERVFARANPWLNTFILVGPALLVGYWNLTLRNILGVSLPGPLTLAMLVYIGISLLVEARIGYGGCEVVALPILVFRRRYVTYCVPIVLLDASERGWVDSVGARRWVWVLLGGAALATILLAILNIQPLLSGLALLLLAGLISLLVVFDARTTRGFRRGAAPGSQVEAAHEVAVCRPHARWRHVDQDSHRVRPSSIGRHDYRLAPRVG